MKIRIATYNLFEGAPQVYNRLVDFVRQSNLDVLCFQEVNHWQDDNGARLHDFNDRGLFANFAFGNSNTEYKLATFSKPPFSKSDALIEGYWHCILETRISFGGQNLTIYNVHLDPWQEVSRIREIDRLIRALNPNQHVLIVGDLNSLSRKDNYSPEMIADMQSRGIAKYGRSELEYGVTDYLSRVGFVDIASRLNRMETTVPTTSAKDQGHEVAVRVDYVYASPSLAQFATNIEVVKTEFTNAISDHYPVIVTFDSDSPTPEPILESLTAQPPQFQVTGYNPPAVTGDGGISVIPPDAPLPYSNPPASAPGQVYMPPQQVPGQPPQAPNVPANSTTDENDDTVLIIRR